VNAQQIESLRSNPPPVLTALEAAIFSGLRKPDIQAASNGGTLPSINVEGRRLIRTADLRAWLDAINVATGRTAR
jgi:hypothetical protein